MIKTLVVLGGLTLVAMGCAHHNDVRAGVDGIHRVVIQTEDKENGSQEAIRQANHFCKEQNKYAAFVNEEAKYTGQMDEKDYNRVKTASRVAKAAGGAAYVFGGEKESNLGGVVGLGGVVADAAAGRGYTVEMKFKCQ